MTKGQGLVSTKNRGGSKQVLFVKDQEFLSQGVLKVISSSFFLKHHSKLQPCILYSLEKKY